jgi:BirA family biotin operon repressor/biotin-[acetyl-CoA-carboxylase] ligase
MNAESIQAMAPQWRVQCVEEVSSTSDLACGAGQRGEEGGLVIFAESQTAGRGQRSNRWVTPAGRDLMFSLLLRPTLPMELWPRLTTIAALAVCRAVESLLPVRLGIKWPNDIHLTGRKVCGLLAETYAASEGNFLVLGIGLNVNSTAFPPELEGIATSLLRELPQPIRELEREPLAAALLNELSALMELWEHDFHEVIEQVRPRSLLIGRNIRALVTDAPIHGRVLDLNHEGHLVLRLADGASMTLSSAAEVRAE